MSTLPNPFLRGFQDLSYERVVQISYADDCPPCYRSLHPALHDLPDDGINFQPCLFDDDFAVITDGESVPEYVRIQINDPYEVIFRDQFLQRDREQASLAAGLSLYVGHNEKCSISFDTEHSLKGPGRLLGFHIVFPGAFFMVAPA